MTAREPALLILLIDTNLQRWFVGGVKSDGEALPLIRSEDRNLAGYEGMEFDGQVSFLRHRLAGVLQRGCDRLFARDMKATHFILIADGNYSNATEELTQRLAEHFVTWLVNPPIIYLIAPNCLTSPAQIEFKIVAGELPESLIDQLHKGLSVLVSDLPNPDSWELICRPQPSKA